MKIYQESHKNKIDYNKIHDEKNKDKIKEYKKIYY